MKTAESIVSVICAVSWIVGLAALVLRETLCPFGLYETPTWLKYVIIVSFVLAFSTGAVVLVVSPDSLQIGR